jgi:hypothetical protein
MSFTSYTNSKKIPTNNNMVSHSFPDCFLLLFAKILRPLICSALNIVWGPFLNYLAENLAIWQIFLQTFGLGSRSYSICNLEWYRSKGQSKIVLLYLRTIHVWHSPCDFITIPTYVKQFYSACVSSRRITMILVLLCQSMFRFPWTALPDSHISVEWWLITLLFPVFCTQLLAARILYDFMALNNATFI